MLNLVLNELIMNNVRSTSIRSDITIFNIISLPLHFFKSVALCLPGYIYVLPKYLIQIEELFGGCVLFYKKLALHSNINGNFLLYC